MTADTRRVEMFNTFFFFFVYSYSKFVIIDFSNFKRCVAYTWRFWSNVLGCDGRGFARETHGTHSKRFQHGVHRGAGPAPARSTFPEAKRHFFAIVLFPFFYGRTPGVTTIYFVLCRTACTDTNGRYHVRPMFATDP